MWLERYSRYILYFTLSVVLSFGIVYSIGLGDSVRYLDEQHYLTLATNMATKGLYSLDGETKTAFRPPGYPLLLTPLAYFQLPLFFYRMLNFIALALSIWFCYQLLSIRSRSAAAVGALIPLFYPLFFYAAGTVYPQIIVGCLLLASIWLAFCHPKHPFYLGILQGVLILMVPVFVFVLLFFLMRFYKKALPILVACLFVLTPWTIRNTLVYHQMFFLSTNGGVNLLLGNSENTQSNTGVVTDISHYQPPKGLNEVEKDRFYRKEAMKFIYNNPQESFSLYLKKLWNYFSMGDQMATVGTFPTWKKMVLTLSYGGLLGLCILRVLCKKWFPFDPLDRFSIRLYLWSALFTALFFTRIRFRIPFDLLLVLFAAPFCSYLATWKWRQSSEGLEVGENASALGIEEMVRKEEQSPLKENGSSQKTKN